MFVRVWGKSHLTKSIQFDRQTVSCPGSSLNEISFERRGQSGILLSPFCLFLCSRLFPAAVLVLLRPRVVLRTRRDGLRQREENAQTSWRSAGGTTRADRSVVTRLAHTE